MLCFLKIILFISIALPVYTYAIYPIVLKCFRGKNFQTDDQYRPKVSVIIAAYNEEKVIEEKVRNLLELDYPKDKLEILIGSDGSDDHTVELAKKAAQGYEIIRVFDLPRGGKVTVLNALIKEATGEILLFSDANTMLDKDAVKNIVKHFADERIGCVSGQLRYRIDATAGEGAKSEGVYWKYENWVKEQETKIGLLSGANGALYAIRGNILNSIRNTVINDDFYVSTYVLQAGYNVVMEKDAVAYEMPNDSFDSQFKRHIRDGAGHYQALGIFWKMLFGRKGSFVYVSHRVIKWIVPFLMITAFVSNLLLASSAPVYMLLFACQAAVYAAILIYYAAFVRRNKQTKNKLIKVVSILFYFVSVNISLLIGFFRYISKQQKTMWETQR